MENCLPLHPCSQHCGFGREFNIRGMTELLCAPGDDESEATSPAGCWETPVGDPYDG